MPDETGGYGTPELSGYDAEILQEESSRLAASAQESVRITLHGDNFFTRAMMLMVRIGDTWVQNVRVVDQQTLICFLDKLPEEGAEISVVYSGGQPVVLEERFSRKKLDQAGPSSDEIEDSDFSE